jgi:hypothetical protein
MNAPLFRLLHTHARIDQALQREQRRPLPDGVQTGRLKKLKLKIKDLIVLRSRVTARG